MVATRRQTGKRAEDADGGDGSVKTQRLLQRLRPRYYSEVPCVPKPSTSTNANKYAESRRRNPRRNCEPPPKLPPPKPAQETQKRQLMNSKHSSEAEKACNDNDVKTAKNQEHQKEKIIVIDLDDPNKNWSPPDYSNPKQTLVRELLRCQLCLRTYSDFRLSLKCLQSHGGAAMNLLRCYICFKIFTTTDDLLNHYREDHTSGNRVDTLICPFCPNKPDVPYRSVSCHVCSCHVNDAQQRIAKKSKSSVTDLGIHVSAQTYFHQLSSVNPNRFPRCTCEYC